VVELTAETPLGGMSPLAIGRAQLSEVDLGRLTSLAPYKGQEAQMSKALEAAHGMTAPAPGRATGREGARAIWFGQRMVLLAGPDPDPSLARHAAVTDQSDAWACLRLDGEEAEAVLSRLTPLDLRQGAFKRGHTARTELSHMAVSITRISDRGFLILGFRSMARTLRHDLATAMEGVAARHGP
jgi:heterotetrameric sarcosine oxidase gamma subunit